METDLAAGKREAARVGVGWMGWWLELGIGRRQGSGHDSRSQTESLFNKQLWARRRMNEKVYVLGLVTRRAD